MRALSMRSLPTVEDVLSTSVLAKSDPVVVAGQAGLNRRVRWVHVSEVADIGNMLRGGELLLTTGVALPKTPSDLRSYVEALADANASALVVGLGPRFSEPLPSAMREAADHAELPLVALRRKTAFVDVTEDIHAGLVDAQIRELQATETIHTIFADLAVQGATPALVLRHVARLSGMAVVLENRAHQILHFEAANREAQDVLGEWKQRNRDQLTRGRTSYEPLSGWLRTTVGARGNDWGTLIVMTGNTGDRRSSHAQVDAVLALPASLVMLAEQAASTLALGRLIERDEETLDISVHSNLLNALVSTEALARDVAAEALALDVDIVRGQTMSLVLASRELQVGDLWGRQGGILRLSTELSDTMRAMSRTAVVGPLDHRYLGMLVPLRPRDDDPPSFLSVLIARLSAAGYELFGGIADPALGVEEVRSRLRESLRVAQAADALEFPPGLHRWKDLGLRGLLYGNREDPQFQAFAEVHLSRLIDHDAQHQTNLIDVLETFLNSGRSKSTAARELFISRVWLHERLRRIGHILDVDLDDEATCVTLQVAIAIHRQQRGG